MGRLADHIRREVRQLLDEVRQEAATEWSRADAALARARLLATAQLKRKTRGRRADARPKRS